MVDKDRHEHVFPWHIPNILTISRVALVPVFVSAFYGTTEWAAPTCAGIFILAASTDWLDGYLARRMKLTSDFGSFLDPVADKLMVSTALVLLAALPPEQVARPRWLVSVPAIAITAREITMSALREWAATASPDARKAVAVNSLGKWKTALVMVALSLLLVGRIEPSILRTAGGAWGEGLASGEAMMTALLLLYCATLLALWSLGVYLSGVWQLFKVPVGKAKK